jgi:hypothetical protein
MSYRRQKQEKNGFHSSLKNRQARSWLNLIMMSFSGPTEDTTLKFKVAKPVLIKIKNQPEEKPENLMIIRLFLSAGVWQ